MARKRHSLPLISLIVLLALVAAPAAWAWRPPSKATRKDRIPYRPQWVSVVKKGKLFKYKRKEFSSPGIFGDRIFVGADGGYFYAMKKDSGKKLWRFKTSGPVNSAPAFSSEGGASTVYFGDDDGVLYAINIEDGKLRWKSALDSEILAAPAVKGNRVYVSTIEGKTYAFGTDDGHVIWTNDHPMDGMKMSIRGNTPPVLDASTDQLFVGFADGILRCLSASGGKVLWEKTFQKNGHGFVDIDGAPLIDEDRLYIAGFETGLFALAKKTGQFLWSQTVGSGVALALKGDTLFVSGSNGRLYAYQRKDGSKIWDKKIGDGALTAPVVSGDIVIVGLSDQTMNFVDRADGHVIARRFARKGVYSDPIIDGDRVYYLSNGGRLYSLKIIY